MSDANWAVTLMVSPSAQGVMATVKFTNAGIAPAGLYKWNACFGNQIHNDTFRISSDAGKVPYIGKLAKRGEPTADDFVVLGPGQFVAYTVDLASAYEFAAGKHSYKIQYSALNPYLGKPGFDVLKSSESVFEFSR